MKNSIYIFFVFLLSSHLSGQRNLNQMIDSLNQEFLKEKQDTAKAHILAQIGVFTFSVDQKKAIEINDSLISFSRGVSDKYLGQGYRMKGTFALLENDYETALEYYSKALDLYKKIKWSAGEAGILENFATLYGRMNDNSKAIEYYKEAINLNKKNNNETGNILIYRNLAVTVGKDNNFQEAIQYLIQGLEIAEREKSYRGMVYIYNQIATNYIQLNQVEKAKESLNKAILIAEKTDESYGLAEVYNLLGHIAETNDEKYEEALKFYEKSLHHYKIVNDKNGIVKSFYAVGLQKFRLNKIKEAYEMFSDGLQQSSENDYKFGLADGNLYLAMYYINESNLKLAQDHLNKANEIIDNNSLNKVEFKDQYYRIAEISGKKGFYQMAFDNLKEYSIITDELNKKEGVLKIAELETRYQTEKKEKQIAEQQLQLTKENRNKWLLSGGLIGSLAILGVVGFSYQRNRKQKKQIENLQKELHHRVKNNLSIIDTFIEVVKKELPDAKAQDKLNELQNRIISINEVHRQLYNSKNITSLYLKKYIDTLAENVSHSFDKPEIELKTEIPETVVLGAERSFPVGLIVNEFLTNSYKYAFENNGTGKIWVSLKEKGNNYLLNLSDNGKGLPAGFDVKETNSFGLRIIKLLTEQLNGNFSMKGDDGVSLEIEFPKT